MKTDDKVKSSIKLIQYDPWLEAYEDHIKNSISKRNS